MLLSVGVFGQDVSVSITSIKTSNISLEPPMKLLNPDSMELISPQYATQLSVQNGNLTFKAHNKQFSGKNYIIVGNAGIVSFKANHKVYTYKGRMNLSADKSLIKFVNVVGLDDYAQTVLTTEFSQSAELEAIKAQAVAIRTFALKRMETKNYHLCDTTHCQTYKGFVYNAKYAQAIKDTKGMYLSYKGAPITTMYSTDAGGATSSWAEMKGNSSFPYLSTVKDPFPIEHIKWRFVVSNKDLSAKLKLPKVTGAVIKEKCSSGRVKTVVFKTEKGNKTFDGENLRVLLGNANIKSTLFTVDNKDNSVIFTGVGYGHGYGMCQRSVMAMAKKGWDFKKILLYFYKGATISRVN